MADPSTAGCAAADDAAQSGDEVRWLRNNRVFRLLRRRRLSRIARASAALLLAASASIPTAGTASAPGNPFYAALPRAMAKGDTASSPMSLAAVQRAIDGIIGVLPQPEEFAALGRRVTKDLELLPSAGLLAGEPVAFGSRQVTRETLDAIMRAASTTGVDPVYLMALADKESSFDPAAKAPTSSAEGMYQFIDRTWLQMVRDVGPQHGLAREAALIGDFDGKPVVTDPQSRDRILSLRRDPYLAAVLAAEMLKRHRAEIAFRIGRDLTPSEFYLPHFLGAEEATRLLSLKSAKPKENAVQAFPAAARANRAIFYEKAGRKAKPATVAQVYERLDRMMDKRLVRFSSVSAYAGSEQMAVR